ncbi:MAG: type II secretion system protein [Lachnospiraceae bacterium]|nr:type II secretion system protein [Lachnospiraceae bacterium]
MRVIKDQKGFSLLELVVVAGIVALLAGISFRLVGHLHNANIEKATQYLSNALNKQQTRSMSRANKPYLYIYKLSGSYYYCLSEEDTYNPSTMGTNGMEIGAGFTIKYQYDGVPEQELTEGVILQIYYMKDGTFGSCPKTLKIVTSNSVKTIKFNSATGRHIVE